MKKLVLIALLLGMFGYGQQKTRYQRHGKLTQTQIDAIDVNDTSVIYIAYNTTNGREEANYGAGWVARFPAGGGSGFVTLNTDENITGNKDFEGYGTAFNSLIVFDEHGGSGYPSSSVIFTDSTRTGSNGGRGLARVLYTSLEANGFNAPVGFNFINDETDEWISLPNSGGTRISSLAGNGSGYVAVDNDGSLSFSAGSGGSGSGSGFFDYDYTEISLVGNQTDVLMRTITIPANSLPNIGDGVIIRYYGQIQSPSSGSNGLHVQINNQTKTTQTIISSSNGSLQNWSGSLMFIRSSVDGAYILDRNNSQTMNSGGLLDFTQDIEVKFVLNQTGASSELNIQTISAQFATSGGGSGGGSGTDDQTANEVPITDAGGYFTGADVEAALQELGAGGGAGGSTNYGLRKTVAKTSDFTVSTEDQRISSGGDIYKKPRITVNNGTTVTATLPNIGNVDDYYFFAVDGDDSELILTPGSGVTFRLNGETISGNVRLSNDAEGFAYKIAPNVYKLSAFWQQVAAVVTNLYPSGNAASPDGDEADSISGWTGVDATVESQETDVSNGSSVIVIEATVGNGNDRGQITISGLDPSKSYTLSYIAKATGLSGFVQILSGELDGGQYLQAIDSSYSSYSTTVEPAGTSINILVHAALTSADGEIGDVIKFDNAYFTEN